MGVRKIGDLTDTLATGPVGTARASLGLAARASMLMARCFARMMKNREERCERLSPLARIASRNARQRGRQRRPRRTVNEKDTLNIWSMMLAMKDRTSQSLQSMVGSK